MKRAEDDKFSLMFKKWKHTVKSQIKLQKIMKSVLLRSCNKYMKSVFDAWCLETRNQTLHQNNIHLLDLQTNNIVISRELNDKNESYEKFKQTAEVQNTRLEYVKDVFGARFDKMSEKLQNISNKYKIVTKKRLVFNALKQRIDYFKSGTSMLSKFIEKQQIKSTFRLLASDAKLEFEVTTLAQKCKKLVSKYNYFRLKNYLMIWKSNIWAISRHNTSEIVQ